MRPLRLYQFQFVQVTEAQAETPWPALGYIAEGHTPCEARRSAFRKLEAQLADDSRIPRGPWRLITQQAYTG